MKEPVQMPLQASACEIEKITLPQIVSIKQASEIMNLPPYYLRRVCRENPDLAFQSGVKWYINLGKLAAYYNNKTEQSAAGLFFQFRIGKTYDSQTQRPLLCTDR